jgi:hypothetical protein
MYIRYIQGLCQSRLGIADHALTYVAHNSEHVMHIKELYFRQQTRKKQIQEVQQFSKKY